METNDRVENEGAPGGEGYTRKRQIVDIYVEMFKNMLSRIMDLIGTPVVILAWWQAIERTGKRHPFLSKVAGQVEAENYYGLTGGQQGNEQSLMSASLFDLDIDKIYSELDNVDETELTETFEDLLSAFYGIGRVLFGTVVKFPLEP